MKKEIKFRDIILPNKRINFFVITVLILGVLSGSIFLMMLSNGDKESVILQIKNFFHSVSVSSIDNGQAFKNSLIINYLFVMFLWILGFSLIGVIVNIFITYIKGFFVGFSISSIFLTFGYKGVIAGFLYCIFGQFLNMIVVSIVSIYSFMFSYNLLRIIFSKKREGLMLKKYFIILMLSIIVSFVSSLFEAYLFPNILKLVIRIYGA